MKRQRYHDDRATTRDHDRDVARTSPRRSVRDQRHARDRSRDRHETHDAKRQRGPNGQHLRRQSDRPPWTSNRPTLLQPLSTAPGSVDRGRGGAGYDVESKPAVEVRTLATERETDEHRLAQRQKQIDYGKNTLGYDRYCALIPKHKRRRHEHPMTPDKTLKVSKKGFDAMVRRWRQALHDFDPPELIELRQQQSVASVPTETNVMSPAAPSTPPLACDDPDLDDLDPEKTTFDDAPPIQPSIYDNFDETADMELSDDDDDLL